MKNLFILFVIVFSSGIFSRAEENNDIAYAEVDVITNN